MENKALGKGLSALISQNQEKMKPEEVLDQAHSKHGPQMIDVKSISYNPFQPRGEYDEGGLEELAASIKEKGILQPILVRPNKQGGFEVVAGERRLRASQKAGLQSIPAIVKDISDSETLLLALIENIQRQDLNVIDEAKAFERLVVEFKLNQEEIAQSVAKDRTTVANTLRLLKLPSKIQQQIVDQKISMGHARALLSLNNEVDQLKMATKIIQQSLSVRSVEGLVKEAAHKAGKKIKNQKSKDPDIASLEDELRKILGTKVSVEDKKGRGKLIVEYYSLDDLDRILEILKKNSSNV